MTLEGEVLRGDPIEALPLRLRTRHRLVTRFSARRYEKAAAAPEFAERAILGREGRWSLSPAGARFVADFEGVRLKRYNDPAPGRHCTVGIGHLLHHGPCDGRAGEFDLPNEAAAWELLIKDFDASYGPAVIRLIRRELLTQPRFDALASFTYNCGVGALESSTLRRVVNAEQWDRVEPALMMWTKAGGVVLSGLVRRRRAEARLFFSGPSEPPKPVDPFKLEGKTMVWTT